MTADCETAVDRLHASAVSLLDQHCKQARIPSGRDAVYKDQCIYSFDTPRSPTGLYVCMHSYVGLSALHVKKYSSSSGHRLFLHLYSVPVPADPGQRGSDAELSVEEPERKITRLAIGVEGGFSVSGGEEDPSLRKYRHQHALVVLPDFVRIPLPVDGCDTDHDSLLQRFIDINVPEPVARSAAALLTVDAASRRQQLSAAAGTWDGEARVVSRHADSLQQLDNGVRVPPSNWQCQRCDKTDNLWLNLSDGAILCGRRFFDGSGGNNHALEHFRETGYPLAVKLGTITADGPADVFSYAEDDMVLDPHLERHLLHFGIKLSGMRKTDKSMVELEVEINQRVGEWALIQEQGHSLSPLYGAGYTGIKNLGNSCYMNSVMQALFIIPEFVERYFTAAEQIFSELKPLEVVDDFDAQMAKMAHGLLSGRYSVAPEDKKCEREAQALSDRGEVTENEGIEPISLKNVIGREHAEFSGKRQQDAQEFFLHVIKLIERSTHRRQHLHLKELANPADVFRHEVEERLQCVSSGQVRYKRRVDYCLSLPVPLSAAVNSEEVGQYEQRVQQQKTAGGVLPSDSAVVRARVPYEKCIEAMSAVRTIEHFYSPAIAAKTSAEQTLRMASFPDWLLIQLQKFTIGEDWRPRKLDVCVDMPQLLDLEQLRGLGLQPSEKLMPDDDEGTGAGSGQNCSIDESVVAQLMEMGFPANGCRRAVHRTGNSGAEPALQWIMEHLTDADFDTPFSTTATCGGKSGSAVAADEASVQLIVSMGFSRAQAERALRETANNVERAADWIFNHQHELDDNDGGQGAVADDQSTVLRDGRARYELAAFVSHMGTSTESGHYVCHVLRDGRWCIYNDEKVAESRQPPVHLGYLYLYRRKCD